MGLFKKKERGPDDPEAPRKVPLSTLFRYTTRWEKVLLVVALIVAVFTGAALPIISILQGSLTESFILEEKFIKNNYQPVDGGFTGTNFTNDVLAVVYSYAYLSVAVFIAACIQVGFLLVASENMMDRLRRNFMQAILKQEIAWFDKNSGGSLSTQLFDNLERVREGTGDKMGLAVQLCAQFITGFVIAFCYDWRITLIMLAITPVQVICGYATAKIMAQFLHAEQLKYGKAGKIAEEVISSIRTVVAFNGLERECLRYNAALKEARQMGIRRCIYIGLAFGIMGTANFIAFAIAFYVGVGYVHEHWMTPGTLMTCFFAVMMGSTALGQAGPQIAVVGAAQGAATALFDVLDRVPEIESTSPEGIKGMKITGLIKLEDVKFKYPSRPDVPILKGVTLTVEPGEKIALVGSSGSGKSTIVSLLLRYYDIESGRLTLDGHPISAYNLHFLRNVIGVVSQEPILFNCSIAENIRFGREDVTPNEIKAACAVANAAKFIEMLPLKYETLVGDRGTQLSGGQKQRIAIARALVRSPQILLLDEATSALDAESERTVQKALDKASTGRTTIIIAHRLSTIRDADKIIAMKHGEIVEMGNHETLMLNKGLYYDLVTAQTFTDATDAVGEDDDDDEDGFPDMEPIPNGHRQSVSASRRNSLAQYRHANRTMSNVSAISHHSTKGHFVRQITNDQDDGEALMRARTMTTAGAIAGVSIDDGLDVATSKSKVKKDDLKRLEEEMAAAGLEPASIIKILLSSRRDWPRQAVGFFFVILLSCVTPAYSIIFTKIMDIFTEPLEAMLKDGHIWSLMFLVLAAVQGISLFMNVYLLGACGERLTMSLRARLFRNLISHEIAYFDTPAHACGKLCTRLASDVPHVRSAIDYRLGAILMTVLSLLIGVVIAFIDGWQMAFVTLAVFPIFGLGIVMRHRVTTGSGKLSAHDLEESGKVAMEAIENIRTVQALTREELFHRKFCSSLDGIKEYSLRQAVVQGISYGFASCSLFIMLAIAYRVAIVFVENKIMRPIPILEVLYAIAFTAGTLGLATSYVPEFMKAKMAGGIVFNMLDDKPVIDNLTKEGKRMKLIGNISFRDVRFCYPERPQIKVLQGLNLDIKLGQTVALVGASGCGKSTTIALLERFYDVDGGQVLLDGNDIRELNPADLRSQIALVSQEPTLFDCSIRENIIYGIEGEVPQFEVERAARLANVHDFISSLPYAYDTNVGERGTQLSGGQKQRIAIARALVRNPKILLLDEATSALDTESERMVQDALDAARAGRTCLTIAHRLSSIINSDVIAVVQKGVIVEKGTHTELMALRGIYADLNQKQVNAPGSEKK